MPDRYDGKQIQCHTLPYNAIINTMPYRDTMICSRNVVAVGVVGDARLGILGGPG
jgi:hypothetical protein